MAIVVGMPDDPSAPTTDAVPADDAAAVLALEEAGWRSLCDGTGDDFYGRVMTSTGVMVLAGGLVLDRDGVVSSLGDSPTWDTVELQDVSTRALAADVVLLRYSGVAARGEDTFTAAMSSVYQRDAQGAWRLAMYQQTPVP